MAELGISRHLLGAAGFDGKWKVFIAHEREGGNITDGISDKVYGEDRPGGHEGALKVAPKTVLPSSDGTWRILSEMAS